jgi:hypothetical protein
VAGIAKAADMPFQEAIDYLRQKQPATSTHWTEYLNEAHARSFVVAGATKDALVADFKAAVDEAISEGTGYNKFRGTFDELVKKYGWKHAGRPGWRASVIYKTNMANAYSAGRYIQQTDPDVLAAFPYWEYLHVNCAHPRLQHVAWSGMVLRADDPWWATNYPPNGWGCHCIVGLVNERGLAARGLKGPQTAPPLDWREYVNKTTGVVTKYPAGVDPGFAYNPGMVWKNGGKMPVTAPDVKPVTQAIRLPQTARLGTPEQADETLKPLMQPWADSLTPAESEALDQYKGLFGRSMNAALRGASQPQPIIEAAAALQGALGKARMPLSVATWRAIGAEEARIYTSAKIGEAVNAAGFVSTTAVKSVAADQVLREHGAMVKIIVPAGTRGAAYVHPFPEYRFRQYEVLLNTGTKLRILINDGQQLVLVAGDGPEPDAEQ